MKPPEHTRNVFPFLPLTYPVYIISMAAARVSAISIPSVTSTSANAFSRNLFAGYRSPLTFWWVYSTFRQKTSPFFYSPIRSGEKRQWSVPYSIEKQSAASRETHCESSTAKNYKRVVFYTEIISKEHIDRTKRIKRLTFL